MCGIAGWIDFKRDLSDSDKIMKNMSDTLAMRGPDAAGYYKNENAYLVHRRLVVIDKENGKQPMKRGKYVIVYNGELYNTNELRKDLTKLGYEFEGHSDTEVLLCAFIEWGECCFEKNSCRNGKKI